MRLTSFTLLVTLIASAASLHVPFRRTEAGIPTAPIRFHKRQLNNSSDPFGFTNVQDALYIGTIIIDGFPFEVQLDTGSSDLWIDSTNITFPSARDTNITASIQYLDHTVATGPILISNVTFGNWSVQEQAFISAPGSNATSQGDKGLLGVGPPSLSAIYETLNSSGSHYNGSSFLDNVFNAYPDLPNQITFSLSRDETYGQTAGGFFTISTVAPGFENISGTPKLEVVDPAKSEWITVMNGAFVNGSYHSGGSQYVQSGDLLSVLLDTGTSAAVGPQSYVDAIYSKSPAATYDNSTGNWFVSCDAVFNVSLVFGNETYFIHPIDMTNIDHISDDGTPICVGAFSVNPEAGVDFLLGDSFLRNVYSLFDFGNWTSAGDSTPFMQILSVTDEETAFSEFSSLNQRRISAAISQQSNSSSSSLGPTSSPSSTSSPPSLSPSLSSTPSKVLTSVPSSNVSPGPSSSTSSTPSPSVLSSANKDSVAGAVASDGSSTVDLSGLNRDSYIIMGLVGIAIILLLVNMVFCSRKKEGYERINVMGSARPPHFVDRSYETDKPYSTRYED